VDGRGVGRSARDSSESERSSPPGPVSECDKELDEGRRGDSERRREPLENVMSEVSSENML
jgi:hypothetical protein